MTLVDVLKRSARKYPNKKAVTIKRGYRTFNLTYKELYELSKKVALFLQEHGIKKGDCVLLLAPNSPFWVAVFFGALMRGCRIVPLNVQSTRDFVLRAIKQTGSRILFKYQLFKHELPGKVKVVDIEFLDEIVEDFNPSRYKPVKIKDTDLAQILYTSGTTGAPKGVMLTHKNIVSNVTTIGVFINPNSGIDRVLSILPLSHILEQTIGLILPIYKGVWIVFAHSPALIAQLMNKYHITQMVAVPEFLQVIRSRIMAAVHGAKKEKTFNFLLKVSRKVGWRWFSRLLCRSVLKEFGGKLHTMASGGAPLDVGLEHWWNDLGIIILQGYGLTETSPVVTTNTYDVHRFGSVGQTIKNVSVSIADDGEISVKGPNVFSGYYKNKRQTNKVLSHDGWFRTGDMGEFDKDKFLFLRGRKKYMILGPGGQNVFPEDLEEVLNRIKGVKDSTVLGLDLPGGNVEIHAVLLLNEKAPAPEKIIEIANKQLSSYQHIIGWTVWAEKDFPRSATRKVKKEVVRTYLEGKRQKVKGAAEVSPVVRLLSQVSNRPMKDIKPDSKLIRDLHLDSLKRVELVARIEQDFHVLIDETIITPQMTVKKLQDVISKGVTIKPLPELPRWPRSWWASILRIILQQFFFLFTRIFLGVKVKGLENLKKVKYPVIFMPNHLSNWDAAALCRALPFEIERNLSFAGAYDTVYVYYKKFAWLAELAFNCFSLPRQEGENIKIGLENTGQMLDKGYNVVMYPEGKISKTGKLLPLKEGAGLFATQMGVPIVPIRIEGMQSIFPYCVMLPRAIGTVLVKIGKPMTFSRRDSYKDVTHKIHRALSEL